MLKVVDYRILTAPVETELEKVVLAHISNDWRLQGGVSPNTCLSGGTIDDKPRTYFAQAMVKYEETYEGSLPNPVLVEETKE